MELKKIKCLKCRADTFVNKKVIDIETEHYCLFCQCDRTIGLPEIDKEDFYNCDGDFTYCEKLNCKIRFDCEVESRQDDF